MARAKVVDQDLHAHVAQASERLERSEWVSHDRALGDLDLQPLWRHIPVAEQISNVLDDVGIVQVAHRQIDGDGHFQAGVQPCAALLNSGREDPSGETLDQTGLLRQWDELIGWNESPLRVLPANERLDTYAVPGT